MKCHYEVLEIPRDATDDDVKKAYRKLALKWHPDKNIDSAEDAKIQFQLIRQAYEVLSNPCERRWYDRHRDDIVIASNTTEKNKHIINLFKYYSTSCFEGYENDEKGFFTVYRKLFEQLATENSQWSTVEESDEEIPGFGDINIKYEGLRRFYSYWRGYNTRCSFVWLDIYDITKAPNRQAAKIMEKENKRIRNKAKRERNDQVRNLVEFIRRRDPRISMFGKMFELMTEEKKKKSQEFRKRQLLKRQKEVQEQKESEWSKFSNIQPDLENIEAAVAEEFGEESSDEEDSESLYCVACTKIFKTHKAFSNHENSKKHKDNLITLKASMADNNLKFTSEETEDDDSENTNSLPTGTKLATDSELPDNLLNAPSSSKNNKCDTETSDEELISDTELNTKSSTKNKPDDSSTFKSATDGGYILDEPDDQSKEDGYDTPNDELFSDHEDEIFTKSKKQKKKKSKIAQMPILEDSDDENIQAGLPMGLSKKQRKKHRKEKVLLDKLSNNIKSESNTDNVNNKKKSEKSTSSSSERNQGKVNESDDSSQETVSPLPEKKKGKKAKELRKAQRQAAREAREIFDLCQSTRKSNILDLRIESEAYRCIVCTEKFSSKCKLYQHLRSTTHGKLSLTKRAQEDVLNLLIYRIKTLLKIQPYIRNVYCSLCCYTSSSMADKRLIYPAADRNKHPILSVLQQYIRRCPDQTLLEIASGSGQHVSHFAPYFPHVTFYPSELEERLLESIAAYSYEFPNIAKPVKIDVTTDYRTWPGDIFRKQNFDYIFNACLVHISPFKCAEGLFRNTGQLLKTNGILFTYGPYAINGLLHPESNVNFDQNLRSQNPEWGIRDIEDLKKLAKMNGIQLFEMIDMPQNNKTLVWQKVEH